MSRLVRAVAPTALTLLFASPLIATEDTVDGLVDHLEPPALRDLALEALDRSPTIARARHAAAALAARAPQVGRMPDPRLSATWFALPPETRVGPQRLSLSVRQAVPWPAGLEAREEQALWRATAAEAEVEATRLDVLTDVRRLAIELAFLDRHAEILRTEKVTLSRFEEAAQARYAVGSGLQQEVVRIQTRLTEVERVLLDLAARHASRLAELNALRDRPPTTPAPVLPLTSIPLPPASSSVDPATLDPATLDSSARPELAAARARIGAAQAGVDIASAGFKPDLELGASYTLVDGRGGASAPPDDGDDIFALTGGVRLPVRRARLEAALEEALAAVRAAEAEARAVEAGIASEVGDLEARIPLLLRQHDLLERVLSVQARESLRSAESAYTTGRLGAVDLLDAEVLQLDVQVGLARLRADLALAAARLERALARPLDRPETPDDR